MLRGQIYFLILKHLPLTFEIDDLFSFFSEGRFLHPNYLPFSMNLFEGNNLSFRLTFDIYLFSPSLEYN